MMAVRSSLEGSTKRGEGEAGLQVGHFSGHRDRGKNQVGYEADPQADDQLAHGRDE